ncbi:mannosyltransferase domain protein, putative [Rhizoctonia solani AG-3 Rhs1AP]|uniref:Mannosyltransferase domain protein, putative n=2 Tax=Rhizoctonia solani AG-3 TaxID=1086053 RepID=X8J1X4_9AGAM|nr:mannosyltransferase domain protein, putative [Rhizoctonia solani AG-3 Rhs1AP]KEP45317.1 putative mannosyltransferase domain protein [Rhizoctonia solani 123E]
MLRHSAAAILNFPNPFNDHALAILLPTSLILSIATIVVGLVVPIVGFYHPFIPITIAPLTLVHHISITWFLYKHRDETLETSFLNHLHAGSILASHGTIRG